MIEEIENIDPNIYIEQPVVPGWFGNIRKGVLPKKIYQKSLTPNEDRQFSVHPALC